MISTSAQYSFGLTFARFRPLNADLTSPSPTRMIGGIGPFDFSGEADPSAVPLSIKIDNGAVETVTIDVETGTGSVDESAVTVDELVTAITTAAPTDITATKDVSTGRIKLAYSGAGTPLYVQVYGRAAVVAEFGQGFSSALQFIKSDTLKSLGNSPTMKDDETFTNTDAEGRDVEVITDGYRKGSSGTIVDTADDYALKSLLAGGVYDATAGTYEVPKFGDSKVYFEFEMFWKKYTKGTNKEADLVGYVQTKVLSAKGNVGDVSRERGFADNNYTWTATSYKDENGDLSGDQLETALSKEAYEALDLYNV